MNGTQGMTASVSLAAVAAAAFRTEVRDIPIPAVAPDAGLLRIEATGICGSDWAMYASAAPGPRILGHEMVGRIAALGDLARERWGVTEGDCVALEEYLPCGHCEYCRSGEYRSCFGTDTRMAGTIRYGSTPLAIPPSLWGGFSQFLYLHPRTVMHRVPAGVPAHIAAMAIPLGNGFQWAVLDGAAGPGKTVVVQGPGQTGLACVIAAKTAGAATVIVAGLSRDAQRLAVAKQLGADHIVAVDQEDIVAAVARITERRMADLVIEATSAGPEIINASLPLVRKRGTLIIATRKGQPIPAFDFDRVVGMQMRILGVRGHSYQSVELALGVMAEGRVPLHLMSSLTVGLADVHEALRTVGGQTGTNAIHITVDPWTREEALA
jgi:threonine dehydrogenase-like Zn-dependent dehydrogenase